MEIGDYIALAALFLSVVNILKTHKNTNERKRLENIKDEREQANSDRQIFIYKNNHRISLMPHLYLSLENDIYEKETDDGELLYFPISLINLGKETVTSIRLVPLGEKDDSVKYFRASNQEQKHYIVDYIDSKYARNGEKVNFLLCWRKHNKSVNVIFKIHFSDLVGRGYEQEFRFQYWHANSNSSFSMNNISQLPVCIKNKDETVPIDSI